MIKLLILFSLILFVLNNKTVNIFIESLKIKYHTYKKKLFILNQLIDNYQKKWGSNDLEKFYFYIQDLIEKDKKKVTTKMQIGEEIFQHLDKYLHSTTQVKLGINTRMEGSLEYSYNLLKYEINCELNHLFLTLEKDNKKYYKIYNKIENISFYSPDENDIKIIINSHRLYLYYSKKTFLTLNSKFKSEYITYKSDLEVYRKYEYKNIQKYESEKFKYLYKNYELIEKTMVDNNNNTVIMISAFDKKKSGTINIFSENGYIGYSYYTINEYYTYIIDIQIKFNHRGVGIGSNTLNLIESISKKYGRIKITGFLSSVDFDEKDKLINFYKKNNYEIDSKYNIKKYLEKNNLNS